MFFGLIEWSLAVEGIVLLVAGICGSTAYWSRPVNQDPDAFLRAMTGFWRTVGARRLVLDPVGPARVETADDDESDDAVTFDRPMQIGATQPSVKARRVVEAPESPVLRGGVLPTSVSTCTFAVNVMARSPTNDIVGHDHGGLRIAVSGAADDAVANKLVLAIVAREFNVRPYQVTLTRGHFGPAKAVRIAGVSQDEAEHILRKFPTV